MNMKWIRIIVHFLFGFMVLRLYLRYNWDAATLIFLGFLADIMIISIKEKLEEDETNKKR